MCTRYFSTVSTLYLGRGGGEATHFETDNSAFLKLQFKNTENLCKEFYSKDFCPPVKIEHEERDSCSLQQPQTSLLSRCNRRLCGINKYYPNEDYVISNVKMDRGLGIKTFSCMTNYHQTTVTIWILPFGSSACCSLLVLLVPPW